MKYSRRNFLNTTAHLAGAATLLGGSSANAILFQNKKPNLIGLYRGALAVMQGLTTNTTSQFIILIDKSKKYGYQITDTFGSSYPFEILCRETRGYSDWGIEKILVTGLSLHKRYTLNIIDLNSGFVVDERYFLSLDTTLKNPSIMIASCMKDNREVEREKMWDHVASASPDLIFLIGDTCYADNSNDGSDAGYWRRYVETRSLLSHFRQKTLIPTLAVWDDHDFAGNNADGTFPKKQMTKELFQIFWDNENQEGTLVKGPGVSQLFTAFNQRFFFMDSRYYRSPREATNPVHWGQAQEDFLFENLHQNNMPSWIMNGSQFFGGYLKKDAFEYWQKDNFQAVCRQLAKVEAPVVFASGDIHFSEYMTIEPQVLGYTTYEITSSSIHSTTIPYQHLRDKNPRRIKADSNNQFAIVQSEVDTATGWKIAANSYKLGMIKTLSHEMTINR